MRKYFLSTLAILIGFTAFSQSTKSDSLSGERIIIVQEFEPVITDAKKINNQPVLEKVERKSENFKYDFVPQNSSYAFTPDTITPAKLRGEPLPDLYHGYAKAGIGNYLNTLGELHVNSVRSRDFQWGMDFNHLGSNGGIPNLPYNGFSQQLLDLTGKKMLKNHIINAGFVLDNEKIYHYGINPGIEFDPDSINKDDIEQRYFILGGKAGIHSFFTDSNSWNYEIDVAYYNLKVNPLETTENNFTVKSQFSKYYGKEKGFLYFDVDFNRPSDSSSQIPSRYIGNLLVKPGVDVQFTGNNWNLLAGFKMALEDDDETRLFVYPNAEFKYNVVRNLIVPYAGVTGGIKRTSINTLRKANPFITGTPDLKNERTSYDSYIGVRGIFSSQISYNLTGGYKVVRDMALFVSNDDQSLALPVGTPDYGNIYQPVYDTVNIAYAKAQVSYQKEEKWSVLWSLAYFNYETKNEIKAWNLPEFTSNLSVRYDLQNKIVAKGSITFMGSRYTKAQNFGESEELAPQVYGRKLNPVFDFNLGAEYRFTKQISAFIDINNIASQNYEIWGNYKVQGINVMGGLTFSFWEN